MECKPCSLEHCQRCHGSLNESICDICENDYEEELLNGIITLCKYRNIPKVKCKVSDGKKCSSCSLTEDNKYISCNPPYVLVDGKCQPEPVNSEKTEKLEK